MAKLANLTLKNDEIDKFEKQLAETLKYVENLQEIDTENIEPTAHVTGLENITREDKAFPSLTQKQALSNTDHTRDGFFEVGGILDNG